MSRSRQTQRASDCGTLRVLQVRVCLSCKPGYQPSKDGKHCGECHQHSSCDAMWFGSNSNSCMLFGYHIKLTKAAAAVMVPGNTLGVECMQCCAAARTVSFCCSTTAAVPAFLQLCSAELLQQLSPAPRLLLTLSSSNYSLPCCAARTLQCQSRALAATTVVSCRRVHAVCAPGTYELCPTATTCSCVSCGTAFYCPGGARDAANAATAAQRGLRYSCHQARVNAADTTASVQALGLTTRSNSSTTHTECLPMPGWR
jgi:hypothetical protein